MVIENRLLHCRAIVKFSVSKRNPFNKPRVPILLQPYRYLNDPRTTNPIIRRLLSKIWRPLFRVGAKTKGNFVYTCRGKQMKIFYRAGNSQFHSVYFNSFAQGFEPEVAAMIDALADESSVFLDIGANWGHHSLYLASKPGFSGKIVAFEPIPETFRDLFDVVKQAGLGDMIKCHERALSDKQSRMAMILPDGISSGNATIAGDGAYKNIQTETLDTIDFGDCPDPDLIKIDAEGHEANILRGGTKLLKRCQPMIIFEADTTPNQKNPWVTIERFKVLERLGYTFFQPGFVFQEHGQDIALTSYDNLPQGHNLILGIYEFIMEERFLNIGSNFLACHKEKVPDLITRAHKQVK